MMDRQLTITESRHGLQQAVDVGDGRGATLLAEGGHRWVAFGAPALLDGAPTLITDAGGREWAFAFTTTRELWVTSRVGTEWDTWVKHEQSLASAPCAVAGGAGPVTLFARGLDGAVWTSSFVGAWSPWVSLGGQGRFAPAAAATLDGQLHVFALGGNDALECNVFDGSWRGWTSLDGQLTSSPAAVRDGVGDLYVFGRGTDNALHYRQRTLDWSPWRGLGGALAGAPTAALDASSRLCVRWLGADGATILQRRRVADWEAASEVDRIPDLDASEPEPLHYERIKKLIGEHPEWRELLDVVVRTVRTTYLRGVLCALHPDAMKPRSELELAAASAFTLMGEERRGRLADLARAETKQLEALRSERPGMWGDVDLNRDMPLLEQLERSEAFGQLRRTFETLHVGGGKAIKWQGKPQGGSTMAFRIHNVTCLEETDEVGKDDILVMGIKQGPGFAAEAFGPDDIGSFSTDRSRDFSVTDPRMNLKWTNAQPGTPALPYAVTLWLVERDADTDPGLRTALNVAAGALATATTAAVGAATGAAIGGAAGGAVGGPVGALAGALVALAWVGISSLIADAQVDEQSRPVLLPGYAGMPNANQVQTTLLEWDGGRYQIAYSWSPPDLFAAGPTIPPFVVPTSREFMLYDAGPFAEFAVTTTPAFGLWCRRADGSVLYKASPTDGNWTRLAGEFRSIDNAWATLASGAVGRFDRATLRYIQGLNRKNNVPFTPDSVAATGPDDAVCLDNGLPYQTRVVRRPGNGDWLFWNWDQLPSPDALSALFVTGTGERYAVWALDAKGMAYERVGQSFLARPNAEKLASLAPDGSAGGAWGVGAGGQVTSWSGAAWAPYHCYTMVNGAQRTLIARQIRHAGAVTSRAPWYSLLLAADGKLYWAGSNVR